MNEKEQQAYNEALEKIQEAARTKATELSLFGMVLTKLPPEIGQLTGLQSLDLGGNQLSSLPAELFQLTGLQRLDLDENQLSSLPAELFQLTGLQVLYLGSNNFSSLPAELFQLTGLQSLDLGGNQLSSLPAEFCQLTGLQRLDLDENQLSSLPAELFQLTGLQSLDLRSNKFKEVPELITNLDMEITWEEFCLANAEGINLYGNPLEVPPVEIVKQGKEAVRNYFESIKTAENKGEDVKLNEAKLLVVGPGGAGKTFLSNRLVTGTTPETKTTEGIDIFKWIVDTNNIKDFRVNLWDFGGQEIYHSTHQFFLTKRSLYLFVWEARKDEDRVSFSYWLNVIKLLSDNAPVLVVMNKCDERTKEINQASIQKQFPNVIGFYKVSAKENTGIDDLRSRIIDEIEKLDHIGTKLPKQWVDIRSQLEGMKESGTNYITYREYEEVCSRFGLWKDQAKFLAEYYHELGVILHFSDNSILKDIVFLNSEWATDAVYKITDCRPIVNNCGKFNFDQLKEVWKDYPEDKYCVLLELMMKFELCFNLNGTPEYIVPELLKAERSEFKWSYKDNMQFQYDYEFMPAGIVTRFMVRKHEIIKGDLYWKSGVVMKWEGTEAFVECNEFDGKIDIRIKGEDAAGLLAVIHREIEHIHNTLNHPTVAENLACVCSECVVSPEPYFYDYAQIRNYLSKGVRIIRCGDTIEEVSIERLLKVYGIGETEEEEGWGIVNNDVPLRGKYPDNTEPRVIIKMNDSNKKWYEKINVIVAIAAGIVAIAVGGITIYNQFNKKDVDNKNETVETVREMGIEAAGGGEVNNE